MSASRKGNIWDICYPQFPQVIHNLVKFKALSLTSLGLEDIWRKFCVDFC